MKILNNRKSVFILGCDILQIIIEPNGSYTIYEQIVNQIKSAIITGQMVVGEPLMSIRGLAAELGVSVITTKRAYEELEREGLIKSMGNKGFFVCEYNADYLREKQLMEIENHLSESISMAMQAGMSKEDIVDMVKGLIGM